MDAQCGTASACCVACVRRCARRSRQSPHRRVGGDGAMELRSGSRDAIPSPEPRRLPRLHGGASCFEPRGGVVRHRYSRGVEKRRPRSALGTHDPRLAAHQRVQRRHPSIGFGPRIRRIWFRPTLAHNRRRPHVGGVRQLHVPGCRPVVPGRHLCTDRGRGGAPAVCRHQLRPVPQ